MKVILRENIENLGKKGDIINVAAGYGRNYLIPKKIALEVTPTNKKMIELEQKALRKGLEQEMKSYQALSARLNEVELTFKRKAGEKDSIFGSVSVADIKEALDELDFSIEKKRIMLDDPLKKLGNYSVTIKVFHDEKAEIKVAVVKEGEEEQPQPETVAPDEAPIPEVSAAEEDAPVPADAPAAEKPAADSTDESQEVPEAAAPAEPEPVPGSASAPEEKDGADAEKTTE